MIIDTALPVYAAGLVGVTAWIRLKRPRWPLYVAWFLLPAVAPAMLATAWAAGYALEAEPRLALSLFLAYVVPAWFIGAAICAVTDLVTRKVCGA